VRYGRQSPQPGRDVLRSFWTTAAPKLSRRAVFLDDRTRPVVADALADVVRRLGLTVGACAIMNDHVHVLAMRTTHRIEYVVGQLKGSATRALGAARTPWAKGCWKVSLNDRAAILAAARYIDRNPLVAGMDAQHWRFVTPIVS